MKNLLAPAALVLLTCSLTACSPDSVYTAVEGPKVRLDAGHSHADYEVKLCAVDADLEWAGFDASVTGVVTGNSGHTLLVEAYGATQDADPTIGDGAVSIVGSGELFLELDLESENFEGSGRRCDEPQLLRFEVVGALPETDALEVEWSVHFGGEYGVGLFGDALNPDKLVVEIEQLSA